MSDADSILSWCRTLQLERKMNFLAYKNKVIEWGRQCRRECKERLATIAPRPTQRQRKALTCSCSAESCGGSYTVPERIVPAGEIPYDPISQWDAAKKKQMKEYADKRRNARESLIVVGDQVLLKQSKADVLTPPFVSTYVQKCMQWRKRRNWWKIASRWRFELDAKSGLLEAGDFGKNR